MILYGIATKPVKRGPMVPVKSGLITSTGLDGNYYNALRDFVRSKRQVTVISLDQWNDAMKELDADLPWHIRRANLCVSSHNFGPDDMGKTLIINGHAALEITGETGPCKRMEEILPGLQAALTPSWRGGVTCRVLKGGAIRSGENVVLH